MAAALGGYIPGVAVGYLTNLILRHLLGLSGDICYHWYTALPVTIIILAVLYPIIVIAKPHFPILLGKKDEKGLF